MNSSQPQLKSRKFHSHLKICSGLNSTKMYRKLLINYLYKINHITTADDEERVIEDEWNWKLKPPRNFAKRQSFTISDYIEENTQGYKSIISLFLSYKILREFQWTSKTMESPSFVAKDFNKPNFTCFIYSGIVSYSRLYCNIYSKCLPWDSEHIKF